MWSHPLVCKDWDPLPHRGTIAGMFYISSSSQARNSQELIDGTTGVVLAPEVQPGPHQVMALSMG